MTVSSTPAEPEIKLSTEQIARFESFLTRIKSQTYPEPPSGHSDLTRRMLERLEEKWTFAPWTRVLDVGCGQGVALELFAARGCSATGIALNTEDVRICRERGLDVIEMDQSFLEFPNGTFDVLWCRHCLEHSFMPLFTLAEFERVLKPGGLLYVEVPAPDTLCAHQENANHYSVLGESMWRQLLIRSGFKIVGAGAIGLETEVGADTYWCFVGQKQCVGQPQ